MTRPLHQRIFYWGVYLLIGYALAGTFLDATSNAISIVSPKLGIILTVFVLVTWASIEILLKTRSLLWLSKEGQRVQLRALGTKTRLALIGAAVLLLVPLVTKSIKNLQRPSLTRAAVTDHEAESAEPKETQPKEADTSLPQRPLDSHSQAQRQPSEIDFTLHPQSLRDDGELPTIPPLAGMRVLRLHLSLFADKYQSYQGKLTKDGRTLASIADLPANIQDGGKAVIMRLPTQGLASGDYVIELSGTSNGATQQIADYFFRLPDK